MRIWSEKDFFEYEFLPLFIIASLFFWILRMPKHVKRMSKIYGKYLQTQTNILYCWQLRGVSGYLELGGQVVMLRATAAAPPPGGAFYSTQNWVGNCPPCPPATYAPATHSLSMYL